MDILKLEYEIKKNGYTISSFCEKIGMSRSAFNRKCKEETQFTKHEIEIISKTLYLKNPMEIFFTELVS